MSFGRGKSPPSNVSGAAFGATEDFDDEEHQGFHFFTAPTENAPSAPMGRGFGFGLAQGPAPVQQPQEAGGFGGFGQLPFPAPNANTNPNPNFGMGRGVGRGFAPFGGFGNNNVVVVAANETSDDDEEDSDDDDGDAGENDIILSFPKTSYIKSVRPICRRPREGQDERIVQFALSPQDGKTMYFFTRSLKSIYKIDIPDENSPIPTFKRAPRAQLVHQCDRSPNGLFGNTFRPDEVFIWVEKESNQLMVLSRKIITRLSRDYKAFETIHWAGNSPRPMEGTLREAASGKIIFTTGQPTIYELVISGSIASAVQISDVPKIPVWPARFEMAPDGTLFCSNSNSIQRSDKGSGVWRPFAGQGKAGAQDAEQRRSGQALLADLCHAPVIACDPNSNLLVMNDTKSRSSTPYTALMQYFFKDGSRFETIGTAKELLPKSRFITKWSSQIVFHPTLPRFYMASEDYIIAVDFEIPAPPPPVELSRLWHSHPEIADFTLSSSSIHLHRPILAARWPALLEALEKNPQSPQSDIPEEIFQIALRYAYDEVLPFGENNISPAKWIRVMRYAREQGLDDLIRRCVAGYQRALWFAEPQTCIAGVVAAAEANESELIPIAKNVLSLRPEALREHMHLLSAHVEIVTHVLQQFARQLCGEKKPVLNLEELEVPSRLGDDLVRLLDSIPAGQADMKLHGVPCHRAVLVARCPFIEMALGSVFKESITKEIKISDDSISSEAIGRLMRFLYTNEVSPRILSINPDICEQILRLADFLQMNAFTDLVQYCSGVINA